MSSSPAELGRALPHRPQPDAGLALGGAARRRRRPPRARRRAVAGADPHHTAVGARRGGTRSSAPRRPRGRPRSAGGCRARPAAGCRPRRRGPRRGTGRRAPRAPARGRRRRAGPAAGRGRAAAGPRCGARPRPRARRAGGAVPSGSWASRRCAAASPSPTPASAGPMPSCRSRRIIRRSSCRTSTTRSLAAREPLVDLRELQRHGEHARHLLDEPHRARVDPLAGRGGDDQPPERPALDDERDRRARRSGDPPGARLHPVVGGADLHAAESQPVAQGVHQRVEAGPAPSPLSRPSVPMSRTGSASAP